MNYHPYKRYLTSIPMSFEEHAAAYRDHCWVRGTRVSLPSPSPSPSPMQFMHTNGMEMCNDVKENLKVSSQGSWQLLTTAKHDKPSSKLAKRHQCLQCLKCFDRPSTLKTHMNSHTGARPHKCKLCAAQFSVPSNLKRHAKRFHAF